MLCPYFDSKMTLLRIVLERDQKNLMWIYCSRKHNMVAIYLVAKMQNEMRCLPRQAECWRAPESVAVTSSWR